MSLLNRKVFFTCLLWSPLISTWWKKHLPARKKRKKGGKKARLLYYYLLIPIITWLGCKVPKCFHNDAEWCWVFRQWIRVSMCCALCLMLGWCGDLECHSWTYAITTDGTFECMMDSVHDGASFHCSSFRLGNVLLMYPFHPNMSSDPNTSWCKMQKVALVACKDFQSRSMEMQRHCLTRCTRFLRVGGCRSGQASV